MAASIYSAEEYTLKIHSRFLRNVGTFLPEYTVSRPEDTTFYIRLRKVLNLTQ
jgi:hypothetical protein